MGGVTRYRYLLIVWLCSSALQAGEFPQIQYQTKEAFVDEVFEGKPTWKMVKLSSQLKKQSKALLGHRYRGGRIRYWEDGKRTAWVIDEIGKEMPITIGVSVLGGKIETLRILVYREERGGEVHQASFTRQFIGERIRKDQRMLERIDGITGATLSVAAVSNVAEWVLTLDAYVGEQ